MGPLVQRDPSQRERERVEKARERNETEGLRQGRKEGRRRGWMEKERGNYTAFRGN